MFEQSHTCSVFVLQVVWMKNEREVKMGKKYEYVTVDCKRILMVHNVTEEDLGIYQCVLADDRLSWQLTLKGKKTIFCSSIISKCFNNIEHV